MFVLFVTVIWLSGGGSAYHDWVHIQNAIIEKGSSYSIEWVEGILYSTPSSGFNCTLSDRTMDMGMLSVQGPNSRQLLQALAPDVELTDQAFPFATTQTGYGSFIYLFTYSNMNLTYYRHLPYYYY